ncbi:uncharacterized protein LOC143030722 isoform X2 [Oratosquilla oratoria]
MRGMNLYKGSRSSDVLLHSQGGHPGSGSHGGSNGGTCDGGGGGRGGSGKNMDGYPWTSGVNGLAATDGHEHLEVSSVSYLTVPPTPNVAARRPSTADLVIEKLNVEKVDGGGLSISGVALASNCHVTLLIFGCFFLLAGIVLSYVSYSSALTIPSSSLESPSSAATKSQGNLENLQGSSSGGVEGGGGKGEGGEAGFQMEGKTQGLRANPAAEEEVPHAVQMRIIGPVFLLVGFLMFSIGLALLGLSKKITKDEKAQQKALSELQLCQLENSFNASRTTAASPLHTPLALPGQEPYPVLAIRRGSWWLDPTPIESPRPALETLTGTRRDSNPLPQGEGYHSNAHHHHHPHLHHHQHNRSSDSHYDDCDAVTSAAALRSSQSPSPPHIMGEWTGMGGGVGGGGGGGGTGGGGTVSPRVMSPAKSPELMTSDFRVDIATFPHEPSNGLYTDR